MSKLFELYVLGLLKERFNGKGVVDYHITTAGNELDFLLNAEGYKMVIDAKYKPRYSKNELDADLHKDIRQISGYARLEKVMNLLGLANHDILIDCLIIYPRRDTKILNLMNAVFKEDKAPAYRGIYLHGVSLPQIE